jgi:hypothetical protein
VASKLEKLHVDRGNTLFINGEAYPAQRICNLTKL